MRLLKAVNFFVDIVVVGVVVVVVVVVSIIGVALIVVTDHMISNCGQ